MTYIKEQKGKEKTQRVENTLVCFNGCWWAVEVPFNSSRGAQLASVFAEAIPQFANENEKTKLCFQFLCAGILKARSRGSGSLRRDTMHL